MMIQKRTKNVATIGPASDTEELMEQLINAGMNVARFNTKHGTPEWHRERILRVKAVAARMNQPIAVLLDLQGPEIRTTLFGEPFPVVEGEEVVFTSVKKEGVEKQILIPQNVIDTLEPGHLVLLDNGLCEFELVRKTTDHFFAKSLGSSMVKQRKTMNIPGITVDMPSLIPNDLVQLDGMKNGDIDFVGLSFVRNKADIEILRGELKKRNLSAAIVSKIETQAALDNLNEIIMASDAVMVARGDLAVEVPFEQLTHWQKLIINKCRFAAKPVITATQMLGSMVDQPRPTRAEVSDVSNAIYDGTDAVMLSEETTIGKYPVKAVATQAKISAYNETFVDLQLDDWSDLNKTSCVTHAAVYLLQHSQSVIDSVICLTESGATAGLIAKFRPKIVVKAVTGNRQTYNQLALTYGVEPHLMDWSKVQNENTADLLNYFKHEGVVKTGERVLLVYGSVFKKSGFTNSISLLTVA